MGGAREIGDKRERSSQSRGVVICGKVQDERTKEHIRERETKSAKGIEMDATKNPFAKADRWRKHPLLTNTYKHMFPGFFLGAAMFGAYYLSEKVKKGGGKKKH